VFAAPSLHLFRLPGAGGELLLTSLFSAGERLYRLHRLLPEFALPLGGFFTLQEDEANLARQALIPSSLMFDLRSDPHDPRV
jgi:hypothetical protein